MLEPRPRTPEDEEEFRRLRKEIAAVAKVELGVGNAAAQWKLATRELREAARLRPHDEDDDGAVVQLRKLKEDMKKRGGPQKASMARFASRFNLAIRYWDLGKSQMAMREMQEAGTCLKAAGKPLGCVRCCQEIMQRLTDGYHSREAHYRERLKKKPRSVALQYALGVMYFDKRMLRKAEEQLTVARELAHFRKQVAQERAVRKKLEDEGFENEDYDGVQDDLDFCKELREIVDVNGTYTFPGADLGERPAVRLVPCLQARFTEEFHAVPRCEQWVNNLYADPDLDWD